MEDEIKEDINDTTFLERNILGFNKNYDLKLYNQKIKKLENYSLEDYLKYCLKKGEKKQEEEEKKRKKKMKKSNDDDINEIKEMMDLDEEFGEEVEKEMKKGKNEDEIP